MSDMMNYLLLFEAEDSGGGGSGGGAMQMIDLVVANTTAATMVVVYNIYDESASADTLSPAGVVPGASITAKAIAGSFVIVQYSPGCDVTVLHDEVDVTDGAAGFLSGDDFSCAEVATVSFNPSAPRPSQITITVSDQAVS